MSNLPVELQIQQICHVEIPELLQRLPSDCWYQNTLTHEGEEWHFAFKSNSETHRFFAKALGKSPMEAFLIAKYALLNQIKDWHRTRFLADTGHSTAGELSPAVDLKPPHIMIVDDDVDLALATQTALRRLGCMTEVVTKHEGLHKKIISSPADVILLDWKLNDAVTADTVVEKAIRLIDTFSDLRSKFINHRPRIVTHSALERNQVHLPEAANEYFSHMDHWRKPMPYEEIIQRASDLLDVKAS